MIEHLDPIPWGSQESPDQKNSGPPTRAHTEELFCVELVCDHGSLSLIEWEEGLLTFCAIHDVPLERIHWFVSCEGSLVLCVLDTDRKRLEHLIKAYQHEFATVGRIVDERWIHHRHPHEWLDRWRKTFQPFKLIEDITITPSWVQDNNRRTPHRIILDPDAAFGTGLHETTQLCAAIVYEDVRFKKRFLDVGTGSGILLIVASLTQRMTDLIGVDRDPYALSVAQRHLLWNRVGRAQLICCDATKGDVLSPETFDSFSANLQTDVLEDLLGGSLSTWVRKGGIGVVSGVMDIHAASFERRIQRSSRWLIHRHEQKGRWHAWVIERC